MFQKGPGEGYGAAKDQALALQSNLKCRNASHEVGEPYFVVVVYPGTRKRVGKGGRTARQAWQSALDALEASA